MLTKVWDAVFGCRHSNYSFPLTVKPGQRRRSSPAQLGTYVVCLDCGKELAYDWQEMKVAQSSGSISRVSLAPKEAA